MDIKRKPWSKAMAILLVILIILQVSPLTAFANEYRNNSVLQSTCDSETTYDDLKISEEITEERDTFSKTYLLENGLYCSLTSSTPIHKKIKNEWVEINPCTNTPDTIDDATVELSSLSDNNSSNSSEPSLNDGLVIKDNDNQLEIYGAELEENDDGDYSWKITNGIGTIKEYSNILVKPTLPSSSITYDKTQVTVDASIEFECNTQSNNLSYDSYVKAFNCNWSDTGFSPDKLLETDDDFNLLHTDSQIYDYNTINEAGNYIWNITSIYNKWENGAKENNGLVIQTTGTDNIYITKGYLIRYYRLIDKNDTGFTYHYEDMGRAGTLCINDFTNVPLLQRDELSIDGIKMPVSLKRYLTNGLNDDSFGAGGKWNYSSELTYSNNTFIWNTIDGSSKRFQKSSANETDDSGREKWVEYLYNGGECVLWVKPSSIYNLPNDFSHNIIIDEEENTYQFNSSNKLISISSKDNITLNINYGNGEKIVNITDGIGRKYVFDNTGFTAPYNTVKKVSVLDSNDSPITYDNENLIDIDYTYTIRNNKVCLSSATYPDNKTVYYDYDNYGRLKTVKNIDNSKLEIEYYNKDALENLNPIYFSRVKSYTKSVYDTKNKTYIIQNKVEFNAEDTYRRTIKTINKGKTITEISQYNSNLDLLYLIDSDGNEYYADYDNSHTLQSLTTSGESLIVDPLITNYDMHLKKPGGKIPRYWNTINLNNSNCSMPNRNDDYCVEFSNSIEQTRGLYQDVSIDGKKDDKYVISAWGKATSTIPKDSRFWGVRILAQNESGNEEIIHEMGFDTSLWDVEQIRKTAFALPFDTNKLTVQLISCNQLYNVQFDDVELYESEESYVSSIDNQNGTTSCNCANCNESNCPCNCKDESECKHIWCKRGTTTVENSNGLVTKETTTDAVSSMQNSYAYDDNNYYLTQSTDENGTVTYYTYDSNTGKLSSMATGNENNKINYTYNAVGLLKTVSQTVTNIVSGEKVNMLSEYTYDGDALSQISHNGSVYSFDYDKYGNVKNVKISGHSLAEYSYNNSEQVGYILYGNGDKINYTYNSGGNITSISTQKANEESDDLVEYLYEYDSNNKLVSYTDNVNKTVTAYTDDGYSIISQADNTVIYSSKKSDNSDETSIDLFGYTFSQNKSKDAYDIETAQTTASTKYTLPCDTLNTTGIGQSLTVTDYYGRNISSTFKISTDDKLKVDDINVNQYEYVSSNNYKYKTDENNVTTNLVDSYTSSIELHYILTNEEKAEIQEALDNNEVTKEEVDEYYASLNKTLNSLTTHYEYDNAGRITKIFTDGKLSALYQYDEAGQLTEEIDENGATQYTYDTGGNITTKIYYDNVEYDDKNNDFILGEATKVTNYTYNNDEWSDLLTSVDGTEIQYDDMGNPLNYQGTDYYNETINASLTWNGRLLTSLVLDENSGLAKNDKYDYSYNADGLRTEKRRYKWDDNKSSYYLYQLDEYVWENNVLKGYKISYPGLADSNSYIVFPLYDDNNEIIGVSYKIILNSSSSSSSSDRNATENVLYFVKDAQGNIQKMVDQINDYEFIYKYDAYGKLISFTIPKEETRINNMPEKTFWDQLAKGIARTELAATYSVYKEINPFAYKSYFYDGETGLYYNQSRYYSPEWCRFINADDPMLTDTATGTPNANNMFAYCENDPINYSDPTGNAYISNKSLRTTLKSLLLGIGLNPLSGVAIVCLHIGLKSLRNYIIAKATIIAGRFGALINPAVAACSAALALVISGFSATTVARALIEGKGISITWSRTKKGRIYGITVGLR